MTKRRARPSLPVLADVGTVERRQHPDYVPAHRDRTGDRPARAYAHPVDWLKARKHITDRQANALRQVEAHYRAVMGPVTVTANYGEVIRGATETDQEYAARMQRAYKTMVAAIQRETGQRGWQIVQSVCIHGNAAGAWMPVVRAAAEALVRHWRM